MRWLRRTAEISRAYGAEYAHKRQFKTKSASAQEAHEAIRPTDFALVKAGSDSQEQRLYDLIRKRAMASQMADATVERTVATIGISTQPGVTLTATGEVITFEGFLKVYSESRRMMKRKTDTVIRPSLAACHR